MKCWVCGEDADMSRLDLKYGLSDKKRERAARRKNRCYCKKCLDETQKENAEEMREYVRLKKRMMFRTALDKLENQNADMYAYKDAITVVEEKVAEDGDRFDSSYEMLAAIILVYNRMYAKTQYKIKGYQVDFLLPMEQVALEIDGERHRHKRDKDAIRDECIRRALGRPWEVVRIPTEVLDVSATKLPEMIRKILECRSEGKINWREAYK